MTAWQNITNFEDTLAAANDYSPFWTGMLFMIWAIILIITLPFGIEVAILTASFLGFIVGMFLTYMGLVAWGWTMTMFGLILATFIYIMWSRKD